MANPDILSQRLEHLAFDRMMLDMTTPLIKSEEQRIHIEKKKKLLDEWIEELRGQTQDG